MFSKFGAATFAAVLVSFAAQPAAAAGSFSINPYGALPDGTAAFADGSFGNSGIILPGTDQSSFAVGFVLPRDYRQNTPVRIRLSWRTPDTNCSIILRPNFVDRTRANHPASTGNASGGLNPADGNNALVASNVANQGQAKTYVLTADQGFARQLRGDAVVVGFFRRPTEPDDTCDDDLIVSGIQVIYSTR
jgi:hypothetical protein